MKKATRAAVVLLTAAMAFAADPQAQGQNKRPAEQGQQRSQQDGRRFKWWQDEKYQKELGLSTDQASKIDAIWESTVPEIRRIDKEFDTLNKELSRLIDTNAAEPVVYRQIDRVENRRAEIEKARRFMIYRMHRILSAEQNAKFKKLWAAREKREHSPR